MEHPNLDVSSLSLLVCISHNPNLTLALTLTDLWSVATNLVHLVSDKFLCQINNHGMDVYKFISIVD